MMASNNDVSLGNILEQFPDLLMQLLPYIAFRTVFNAIASCNRDTHEKSKAIVPPWPNHYRLPATGRGSIAVWSPDGTRVAYTCRQIITIVEQRHGIIHRINHNRGMDFCNLKFSPDGRFLVSADEVGIVELWNNDVVGNYEQLQRWYMGEDVDDEWLRIDISACSKFIVVAAYSSNRVVFISIENGETLRSLTPQPVMNDVFDVIFSADCCAVFICGQCENPNVIKLWRPYLEDTDENRLITLWEQKDLNYRCPEIIVSNDTKLIAIQDTADKKGWLLSLDNNYNCAVQKLNIQAIQLLQFTSDDECIISATKKGLRYWNIAEKKFTEIKESLVYNENTMENPYVLNCSPTDHCQLIIFDDIEEGETPLYMMKSIFRHQNRIG